MATTLFDCSELPANPPRMTGRYVMRSLVPASALEIPSQGPPDATTNNKRIILVHLTPSNFNTRIAFLR
jgi:hypothetical protein